MSFTSYITVEDAQAYFDLRLGTSAWDVASEADQLKSLSHATLIIDRLSYPLDKTDPAQKNKFPQNGDLVVPEDIQWATAEIALALLDGVDPDVEYANLKMISQTYSKIQSTYDRSHAQPHVLAGVPSAVAWQYIMPYLVDTTSITLYHV